MSADFLQQFCRVSCVQRAVDRWSCRPTASCTAVAQPEPAPSQGRLYKAFLDTPASIWWKTAHTGDEGIMDIQARKRLTAAERDALG
jgi:putative DNA primase/helicase